MKCVNKYTAQLTFSLASQTPKENTDYPLRSCAQQYFNNWHSTFFSLTRARALSLFRHSCLGSPPPHLSLFVKNAFFSIKSGLIHRLNRTVGSGMIGPAAPASRCFRH